MRIGSFYFRYFGGEIRKGRFVEDKLQPFGERLQSPCACRKRQRSERISPSPPNKRNQSVRIGSFYFRYSGGEIRKGRFVEDKLQPFGENKKSVLH